MILFFFFKEDCFRASLVARWQRICLPMQEARIRSLIQEDPTWYRATKPQLLSPSSRARQPQLLSPRAMTTEACTPTVHALQQEKPSQLKAHIL